ncbi:hypothetical protein J2772_000883 [Chryseobacterium jejuense]|nr:hypothetical protein [Chryseobacterium jejuense]
MSLKITKNVIGKYKDAKCYSIFNVRLKDFISDKIEYFLCLADFADHADDIRNLKIILKKIIFITTRIRYLKLSPKISEVKEYNVINLLGLKLIG